LIRTIYKAGEEMTYIDQGNMILNMGNASYKVAEKKDYVGTEDMDEMQKKVIEFFKENSNPTQEDLYNYSDFGKVAPQAVDEAVYELMSIFVQFLTEGRANDDGISEDDVDAEELKMGIEVEKEHTTNKETAKRISLDHLCEISDLYSFGKDGKRGQSS